MKSFLKIVYFSLLGMVFIACGNLSKSAFKEKELYRSDDLVITQVAENSFMHTSFLQTDDFGKVPCNGLIVRDQGEVIVFDTPANDQSSAALIKWVKEQLQCRMVAVIPTHFHKDCLGGLAAFENESIPSYAYMKTVELATENGFAIPKNSFLDSLILKVGDQKIVATFFGEGHTKDNVVGYFSGDEILFGGCLVKEMDATKGYLGDANVAHWSATIDRVKKAYPEIKIVIPGHGAYGDKRLLDYTSTLFQQP